MDEWKQEMDDIRNEIPDLQSQYDSLELELAKEKRKTWAYDLYKSVDNVDAPVSNDNAF